MRGEMLLRSAAFSQHMRTRLRTLAALIAIGGCSAGTASSPSGESRAGSDLGATHAAPAVPAPAPAPAVAQAPAPAAAPAPAPAAPPAGIDFIDDAKLLYRAAACGDAGAPLPA